MSTLTQPQMTRPPYGNFRSFVPEDRLAIEERTRRQLVSGKFPTKTGYYEPAAFVDQDSQQYRRFEDEGDMRVPAPLRSDDPVADPTSCFTSVAHDAVNGSWRAHEPLINKDRDPRPATSAPFGRPITFDNPMPGIRTMNAPWEEKNKALKEHHFANDNAQFSNAKDARAVMKKSVEISPEDLLSNKHWRDAVATRAFYTSSTQRMYGGVDWAGKLPPSVEPPHTTLELRPDRVAYKFNDLKRYENGPQLWQQLGSRPHSWDYIQSRNGYRVYGGVTYCSPSRNTKTQHLPGYMGYTSGVGEVDDPKTPYTPATLVRNGQPRYSDTARRGNIPGYAGCLLWATHHTAHSHEPQPKQASTHRTYKKMQYPTNTSAFKKHTPFARMVTTVPPCNPFSKLKKHHTEEFLVVK